VEDTLGGRLVGAARQARSRPQWFIDLEGPSAARRALIRQSREGGEANANFNKRFSIIRESEILAALHVVFARVASPGSRRPCRTPSPFLTRAGPSQTAAEAPPSEYWRRNCYATFMNDRLGGSPLDWAT